MSCNRNNMFLAIALSAMVIFAWQYFVVTPQMKAAQARQAELAKQAKKHPGAAQPGAAPGTVPGLSGGTVVHISREAALKQSGARVAIDSPLLDGSIALKGAKLDDLRLKKYRETTDPKSPEIVLLAPKGTDYPYFVDFGWANSSRVNQPLPNDQTPW